MTTTATPNHPRGRGRLATGISAATVGALIGVLATTALVDRPAARADSDAPLRPTSGRQWLSADATDHWLIARAESAGFDCRPDAAQRWQPKNIAVADLLTMSADSAERWLAPEFAVADLLTMSADSAERWLCAP